MPFILASQHPLMHATQFVVQLAYRNTPEDQKSHDYDKLIFASNLAIAAHIICILLHMAHRYLEIKAKALSDDQLFQIKKRILQQRDEE